MPHIIILDEAIELLQQKSSAPPSQAQSNLMAALNAADAYAHGQDPDEEIIGAITDHATFIHSYLTVANPPSDIRLQSYADGLDAVVPG